MKNCWKPPLKGKAKLARCACGLFGCHQMFEYDLDFSSPDQCKKSHPACCWRFCWGMLEYGSALKTETETIWLCHLSKNAASLLPKNIKRNASNKRAEKPNLHKSATSSTAVPAQSLNKMLSTGHRCHMGQLVVRHDMNRSVGERRASRQTGAC